MVKKEICPNCLSDMVAESLGWRCNNCGGFISLQDGKFYEYVEKPFMPPMTNADRIRAMSDEELAVFVRAIIRAEDCPAIGCDCDNCFFKEPCFNGSKWHGKETEWLQQPAE